MAKPRIRSIKPEFVMDSDVQKMTDACALFYILLWTWCDDEGKHPLDYQQISAELGSRWHKGKIKLMVRWLVFSGQLRINSDATWLQVVSWSHQKINKPRQPEVKAESLTWLSEEQSRNVPGFIPDASVPDRIGSDQDRIGSHPLPPKPKSGNDAATPPTPPPPPKKPPEGIPEEVKKEWERTCEHYGRKPDWQHDESPLVRANTRNGPWERTRQAVAGFRFEQYTDGPKGYNPEGNAYLHRLERPDRFERLRVLGESGLAGRIQPNNPKDQQTASEPFDIEKERARFDAERGQG